MNVDIDFNRPDRVYHPGERVSGVVIVDSASATSHQGMHITIEGSVNLQLSARSMGVFEAFYSSLKPIHLIHIEFEISPGGKIPAGVTQFPFEFVLKPTPPSQLPAAKRPPPAASRKEVPSSMIYDEHELELYDTYHGVYVNVQYSASVEMQRGLMSKSIRKQKEFIVEQRPVAKVDTQPCKFVITPQSLQNVKDSTKKKIPDFSFDGQLDATTCRVSQPFTGTLHLRRCSQPIRSIELQLVRVESCSSSGLIISTLAYLPLDTDYMEGETREATEIQNIQIADGNPLLSRASSDHADSLSPEHYDYGLPLHMVFPRLFTCSTCISKAFKIEFECNLIVAFADSTLVTENFPLQLVR